MKIKKLILQTSYLQTLRQFYSSQLRLPVTAIDENQISIRIGSSELIFSESDEDEPFYHFAINIPSNLIGEARNWLSDKVKLIWIEDYQSEIADFVSWHAQSIYFFDPAGNILELIARFDLKNDTNESFSPSQFLSINEVGLVFTKGQFDSKAQEIQKLYSLPYFDKQPPLPQFRAIGDDEGRFILVPTNRNWYPTNKASGMFPTTIEFINEGRQFKIVL